MNNSESESFLLDITPVNDGPQIEQIANQIIDEDNTFDNIHRVFPSFISKLCKDYNVEQFVHLSALGIESSQDSKYAKIELKLLSFYRRQTIKTVLHLSLIVNKCRKH